MLKKNLFFLMVFIVCAPTPSILCMEGATEDRDEAVADETDEVNTHASKADRKVRKQFLGQKRFQRYQVHHALGSAKRTTSRDATVEINPQDHADVYETSNPNSRDLMPKKPSTKKMRHRDIRIYNKPSIMLPARGIRTRDMSDLRQLQDVHRTTCQRILAQEETIEQLRETNRSETRIADGEIERLKEENSRLLAELATLKKQSEQAITASTPATPEKLQTAAVTTASGSTQPAPQETGSFFYMLFNSFFNR